MCIGAAPSLDDATRLLKAKAGAPKMIFEARQQLRRYEVLLKVILGEQHALATELNVYCNRFLSMESFLHQLQTTCQHLPVKIVKRVSVNISSWFKRQAASPSVVPSPDLCRMFDDMEGEMPWVGTRVISPVPGGGGIIHASKSQQLYS